MRPTPDLNTGNCGFPFFLGVEVNRTAVFVDGENFRHSINELFPDFDRNNYLPKNADWAGLFDWLVKKNHQGSDRVRTYWYVVEHVDFIPYRLPRKQDPVSRIRQFLSDHDSPAGSDMDAQLKLDELYRKKDTFRGRFDGWKTLQNGIASKHEAVEFRQAGSIKYDLPSGKLGTEKAVDVKLATDMIILKDIYDIAIIVSGDQDYVPAVRVIKDFGKRVVNVSFKKRSGELLPGGAARLNQQTDKSFLVEHADMKNFLNI